MIFHIYTRWSEADGYLEADLEELVPTEYDPLRESEPVLAHTMAASVQRRIAFGERAGQRVRRIGSGFGMEGEASGAEWSTMCQH